MKISRSHQRLSNDLINSRVLDHPEEFLGPNWKAVLNFWLYLDTLTYEQRRVIRKRNNGMKYDELNAAVDVAKRAAKKTTPYWYCVCWTAYGVGYATWELIGSHEILEQQKPFTFLPFFLNL